MSTRRDIIVIGASTGGLEALRHISSSLSCDLPASILVVLHTSPQSPRLLAGIIQNYTSLGVEYGGHGGQIKTGCMYIAPPDRHMVVVCPSLLGLDSGPKVHYARPAVDRLFESAARHYGPRTIGVVLTGGNCDGTEGLRRIKEAGGLCIVQHPAGARKPDMPMSALRGASPDFCVSLEELGPLLTRLVESNGS
jgi:two-component system, chemotaxis family, protein-glutamate methylesterase/glutaminase